MPDHAKHHHPGPARPGSQGAPGTALDPENPELADGGVCFEAAVMAAAAMTFSSVSVIANALRLRTSRLS